MLAATANTDIGDLLHELVGDAREVARTEIELQRTRLTLKIAHYRGAAVYFAAAGVLALALLITLLVGLVMTLTPSVGPGFATLIVCGVTLIIVAVLALIGRARLGSKAA